ncbi:Por secretion system C-terminal sorting domain-containing protein [Hymenobacter daecheongensis DSM 21074]|uniref:Por secretion system C-terminal sorting domain-containing protein n=1 Tax=Hymenobacter daecheongensis DSM 21074 TaxID=1121955 RepID=A0A1M6EZC0_9BACT|nr:T9SS type A sorting domain-containing protein [Hymenobacter daecheongensis]SHI90824.1 Por secretion system C-terminal sorting domain-containing protein [Hymenobacter daecheongensis DSM 21074]
MKKSYFLVSALLLTTAVSYGQGTELFLSEYTEGAHMANVSYNGGASLSTGNERALEVFNPTLADVNLDAYSIRRYSNGSQVVTEEEKLKRKTGTNVLNSTAAFVYSNGESTITAITSKADQLGAFPVATPGPNTILRGGVAYHNGNDAIGLVRWTSGTAGVGNPVLVDIFGVIGQDPGTSWSAQDAAGVLVTSANQSLIRRPSVSIGTRTNPQPQGGTPTVRTGYNIATEWESYSSAFPAGGGPADPASQSYARLGEHNDYTGPFGTYLPLKTLDKFNTGISIYPNPASGSATVEIKGVKVGSIVVLNNLGQTISAQPRGLGSEKLTLDISALKPGLYFVQCLSADGQIKVYKELVVK